MKRMNLRKLVEEIPTHSDEHWKFLSEDISALENDFGGHVQAFLDEEGVNHYDGQTLRYVPEYYGGFLVVYFLGTIRCRRGVLAHVETVNSKKSVSQVVDLEVFQERRRAETKQKETEALKKQIHKPIPVKTLTWQEI